MPDAAPVAGGRHVGAPPPTSWGTHLKALGAAVIALAIVVAVPVHWTADRAAARNEGIAGRYEVTREELCGRGGTCSYLVDFTSDDGTVRLRDHGTQDVGDSVGETGRAQYFADRDRIYAVDSRNWAWGSALFVAAVAWVVGYGVWLAGEVRLRRRLRLARASRRADVAPE